MFFETSLHSLLALLIPFGDFAFIFWFEVQSNPTFRKFCARQKFTASSVPNDEFNTSVADDARPDLDALLEFGWSIGMCDVALRHSARKFALPFFDLFAIGFIAWSQVHCKPA